jgi:hypothetical protein
VCTVFGTRCVPLDSGRADDARAAGQISETNFPDYSFSSTDRTCDGIDDDCDGRLNEGFQEDSCMNATVPACGSMVFRGTLRCANDGSPERCVAEPGVDYCRFGAGADDDEWDTPDCNPTPRTGCCVYDDDFNTMTLTAGDKCEGDEVEGDDTGCPPSRECTWGSSGRFFCAQRDTDCSPAFCYEPDDTNKDTSAGEVCD